MINCQWTPEELNQHHLSASAKSAILPEQHQQLYTIIDAIDLAIEIGMGKRTNTILQSAFFLPRRCHAAGRGHPYMKDAATKSYLKKGQDVVDMNHRAIDAGRHGLQVRSDVPAAWADAVDKAGDR